MCHSHIPLGHFRPSSSASTKVNSNFTTEPLFQARTSNNVSAMHTRVHNHPQKGRTAHKRRQRFWKHPAKVRSELSVHTAANGFRKNIECVETQISVRFRRKINLLVNKLTLHAQLLTARGDNLFLIFACCLHNLWRLLCAVGVLVHTSVPRRYIIARSGLEVRFDQ